MNQQPTFFEQPPSKVDSPRFTAQTATATKKTYLQLVADYFRARPHQWIDGLVFETFGGRYAWSARIRECRRVLKMPIENRVRVLDDGRKVSEYKYVPNEGA